MKATFISSLLTILLTMTSSQPAHALKLESWQDAEWGGAFVVDTQSNASQSHATEKTTAQDYATLRKPNNLKDADCLQKGIEAVQDFDKQNHLNYVHDIETYMSSRDELVFVVGFRNFREVLESSRIFHRSIRCAIRN